MDSIAGLAAAGFIIFLVCVFMIETGYYAITTIRNPDRRKVRRRLKTLVADGYGYEDTDILRRRILSDVPWLHRMLSRIPRLRGLDRMLQQANVQYSLGFFILLTLLVALSGYLVGLTATKNLALSLALAGVSGGAPIFYVHLRKKQRMQKFQRQLPDALELVARALKAGHAFSTGMKLAAEEFDDPVGTEFENMLDEINFGVAVADALKNLSTRVDCPDLKYFVVSVIVQRETGGNLAEIIESIAHLIRERFKFQGRVRVLAAEGKLSAVVLIILPFVVALALHILNPRYIGTLLEDPAGKYIIAMGGGMMILGILFIRRMIEIKV